MSGSGPAVSRIPSSFRSFGTLVSEIWNPEQPDSFLRTEGPFRSLISSEFLDELLEAQLTAYLEFDASPDILCGESHYAQLNLPGELQLDILQLQANHTDEILRSHPCDIMLGFKDANPGTFVDIELYEHPGPYRNEVFDPKTPLVYRGLHRLTSQQVLIIRAGRQAFRIRDVKSSVVLLLFKSPPCVDFSWTYDLNTLCALSGVVPYLPTYRLFFATRLLGEIPRQRSIANLERLAEHSAHFVRWAAVQSMFSIDFDTARKHLERAAAFDSHPSIIRSARAALQQLESEVVDHG